METGKLNNRNLSTDGTKLDGIVNPMLFKGSISTASDFPTLESVQSGWTYRILADVEDSDATKTHTHQSFLTDAEIAWNGTNWTDLGYGQVKSVAGKTGIVSLVKADVGLSNVDNTTDVNKPVSTAQQSAIDAKTTLTQANTSVTSPVTLETDTEKTIISCTKTITSGKTVLLIGSGEVKPCYYLTTDYPVTMRLYHGSTVVQTIVIDPVKSGKHSWAFSVIVTGLSGSITFTVTAYTQYQLSGAYALGNLIVLEF